MKGRVYSRTKPIPEVGRSFRTTRCQGAPRSVLTWSRQLIAHTPPSPLRFAHCALHTAHCTLHTAHCKPHCTLHISPLPLLAGSSSPQPQAQTVLLSVLLLAITRALPAPFIFGGLVDFSELKFDHEGAHKSWKMCLHVPTKSS